MISRASSWSSMWTSLPCQPVLRPKGLNGALWGAAAPRPGVNWCACGPPAPRRQCGRWSSLAVPRDHKIWYGIHFFFSRAAGAGYPLALIYAILFVCAYKNGGESKTMPRHIQQLRGSRSCCGSPVTRLSSMNWSGPPPRRPTIAVGRPG
jgi:hypothetical protein